VVEAMAVVAGMAAADFMGLEDIAAQVEEERIGQAVTGT